ncbi:MAG: thioesterase family protein, partial [Dehalococcoidia bacterium]
MTEAIFLQDAGRYVPTRMAGSPWADDLVHGGPANGLLARAVELFAAEAGMHCSRLTVDLFRQVPKSPLTATARTLRRGRRIHVVEASLLDGDIEVSRATAVLLRTSETAGVVRGESVMPPGPEGLATTSLGRGERQVPGVRPGFHTTVEARWVTPGDEPGTTIAWLRLPVPLVAGEALSPFVRVAALSDFTNALGSGGRGGRGGTVGFINVDCSLYLQREPEGEWICLEVSRELEPSGVGVSRAALYD